MKRVTYIYIILAFAITWVIVLTGYYYYRKQLLSINELNFFHTAGALGPTLAAWIAIRSVDDKRRRPLLGTFIKMRDLDKITLLILSSPVILFIIGFFLYPLLDGRWYTLDGIKTSLEFQSPANWVGGILPFFSYAIFEEIGWRGFLLPQLQERFTAFRSTFYLTVIWAFWHAPFFLYRFQFSIGMVFGFFIGLFSGAIILTFLYNQSKGAVWLTILFHLFNNVASAFDKKYIVATLSTGFVLVAIFIVVYFGTEYLSSGKGKSGEQEWFDTTEK